MKYIGYICNCQGVYYFLSKWFIFQLTFTKLIIKRKSLYFHLFKRTIKKNLRDNREDSFYGIRRVQSLGKALASRTFVNSSSLYTILSNPIPKPPCGGQPYRNVFK